MIRSNNCPDLVEKFSVATKISNKWKSVSVLLVREVYCLILILVRCMVDAITLSFPFRIIRCVPESGSLSESCNKLTRLEVQCAEKWSAF